MLDHLRDELLGKSAYLAKVTLVAVVSERESDRWYTCYGCLLYTSDAADE